MDKIEPLPAVEESKTTNGKGKESTPAPTSETTSTAPAPTTAAAEPFVALQPSNTWPPPIYVSPSADSQERYYMEYRWYAQWSYYDTKAAQAKRNYQRLQLIIGLGSVTVPVLVGLSTTNETARMALQLLTVFISLMVAAAAAIENVKKYGDSWRTFRTAAEELYREKSLYDVGTAAYRTSKRPFLLFVERTEDIVAKQNGAWSTLHEEQIRKQAAETDEITGATTGG